MIVLRLILVFQNKTCCRMPKAEKKRAKNRIRKEEEGKESKGQEGGRVELVQESKGQELSGLAEEYPAWNCRGIPCLNIYNLWCLPSHVEQEYVYCNFHEVLSYCGFFFSTKTGYNKKNRINMRLTWLHPI